MNQPDQQTGIEKKGAGVERLDHKADVIRFLM
jgi:hypothetical protein